MVGEVFKCMLTERDKERGEGGGGRREGEGEENLDTAYHSQILLPDSWH